MTKRESFKAILATAGVTSFVELAAQTKCENNICPVCKTTAPSVKLKKYEPKSNLVRCKSCNVAFWQDAE